MPEWIIEYYDELDSTNSLALQCARDGKKEGLVIVTEFQTAGRGKPGSEWLSPAGKNLLFSVLLRPPLKAAEAPILTQMACHAIARVLKDDYGLHPEIKRPNDVLVDGRKICGILTESSSVGSRVEAVVVGAGINVNSLAVELLPTATSLRELTGKEWDTHDLLEKILVRFSSEIESLYARPS